MREGRWSERGEVERVREERQEIGGKGEIKENI